MYLVWGLGKSGLAAVRLLDKAGINYIAGDDRDNPKLWKEVINEVDRIILSPGVPPTHPLWRETLKRDIEVIGETELAYEFFKGKVVAITGTDGKSTTTELVYRFLSGSTEKVHKGGNIGIPFSDIVKDDPEGVVVLEVSSFQGKTLNSFRPSAGIFLNFSIDHLDWHPDVEDYLRSKYRIFSRQTEEDFLLLSSEQEELLNVPSKAKKLLLWKNLKLSDGKVRFGELSLDINRLKLVGRHNLVNLMSAAVLSSRLGASWEHIEKTAYEFRGLPYRLEFIAEVEGVRVFNDSKSTTSHSLEAALESFEDGRVLLIAGGKDKGDNFRRIADLVGRKVKRAFLIGETAKGMARAWDSRIPCEVVDSLDEAVHRAFECSGKGDVLLFSPGCSSFDMFKDYKDRGESFNRLIREVNLRKG